MKGSPGVYIHVPFCKTRCSYCDFATDVYRNEQAVGRYVDALCAEIARAEIGSVRSPADSLYFGGGTPSLLSAENVERILTALAAVFSFADDLEFTLEMNPATVTPEKLRDLRSLGVNRASFGVQTFDDAALRLLARGHDARDARSTFDLLRQAGFDNISFDLIAGLPGQTLGDWKLNLAEALRLGPEHLSLYLLEVHEGTPLAEQIRSGRRPLPDEDLAGEMYETLLDTTARAGLAQYEISNFALPGHESRHNSKYWRLDPVFGFGVSAHSFDGRERYSNERDTNRYVELVESGLRPEARRESADLAAEYVFLGLRLNEGIGLEDYRERFGRDFIGYYGEPVERFTGFGLLEHDDSRIRLTRRGMLLSNEVFGEFI